MPTYYTEYIIITASLNTISPMCSLEPLTSEETDSHSRFPTVRTASQDCQLPQSKSHVLPDQWGNCNCVALQIFLSLKMANQSFLGSRSTLISNLYFNMSHKIRNRVTWPWRLEESFRVWSLCWTALGNVQAKRQLQGHGVRSENSVSGSPTSCHASS